MPSHEKHTDSERGKTLNPAPNSDGKRGNHATGAKRGNLNYRARIFKCYLFNVLFNLFSRSQVWSKSRGKTRSHKRSCQERAKVNGTFYSLHIEWHPETLKTNSVSVLLLRGGHKHRPFVSVKELLPSRNWVDPRTSAFYHFVVKRRLDNMAEKNLNECNTYCQKNSGLIPDTKLVFRFHL